MRVVAFFVLPGYLLVLVTGLWMVSLPWPLTTGWIQAALMLWAVGMILLALDLIILRKQVALSETHASASLSYKWVSFFGRVLGVGVGSLVIVILYLMVFKPRFSRRK